METTWQEVGNGRRPMQRHVNGRRVAPRKRLASLGEYHKACLSLKWWERTRSFAATGFTR